MSCSQRKVRKKGLIPAIKRYDGPPFRVLRKYFREIADPRLSVYVLSARFGVIASRCRIPNYNCKMNVQRARTLRKRAVPRIKSVLRNRKFKDAFFIGGRNYLRVIEPLDQFRPLFREAKGKPGQKLKSLCCWLRQ
jgi:hypothetical protein